MGHATPSEPGFPLQTKRGAALGLGGRPGEAEWMNTVLGLVGERTQFIMNNL